VNFSNSKRFAQVNQTVVFLTGGVPVKGVTTVAINLGGVQSESQRFRVLIV
jgi:hypothetical protein